MTMRMMVLSLVPAICLMTDTGAADELPEGAGRDIVEYACSQCHDLVQVTSVRKTPAQWRYLVRQMVAQGAPVEDYETETVIVYLVEHFGEK